MRAVAIGALVWALPAFGQEPLRITLLGTGNPRPSMERFGPSILVEAGETEVVVDVGRGALQRLFQIGAAQQIQPDRRRASLSAKTITIVR